MSKGEELYLKSTDFTFNNQFYSQIYGAAMDSSIFAIIVNLVRENVENEILVNLDIGPA